MKVIQLLLLKILLTHLLQSTPFSPIEAGTFQIISKDLKAKNIKTYKAISLSTPREVFDQNQDIGVLCTIVSINIDQRVGMEFTYKIQDTIDGKVLNVTIEDKNGFVYDQFHMKIDYFIGVGLRSGIYNMTTFQQHLTNQSRNDEQMNPSLKQVHNQLLLFPNGFSSMNLTSQVVYNYISSQDYYTIHYMKMNNHEKVKQKFEGFIPGVNFILYNWILLPKYPFGYRECEVVMQFHLKESFWYYCDKKKNDGYVYGLVGYSGKTLQGHFQRLNSGFNFQLNYIDPTMMAQYDVAAFPYKLNSSFNFIDNRQFTSPSIVKSSYFKVIFIGLLAIVIIVGAVILISKRKQIRYFDLHQQRSQKSFASKTNKQGDKNSDQQMKQEEICHTQVYSPNKK